MLEYGCKEGATMCGINQRESALMVDRVEMVRSLSDMEKLVNHSPKSIMIGSGFRTVQTRPNQSRTVRSMPEPRTVLWSGSGCYLDRGPNHRGTGPKVRFEPWFRTGPRQHYVVLPAQAQLKWSAQLRRHQTSKSVVHGAIFSYVLK
jgi:hypothetical protein